MRMWVLAVSDGRCAPNCTGTPGAARRTEPASSAVHSQPASRLGKRCASSISLLRSKARIDASPASARAQRLDQQRLRAQQRRIGVQARGAFRAASRIHAGHQNLPLMLMVMSVGMLAQLRVARRARHLDQLGDLVLGHGHGRGQKVLRQQEEPHHANAQVAHVREVGAHLAEIELAPHVHGALAAASSCSRARSRLRLMVWGHRSPCRIDASDRSATQVTPSEAP